MNRPTVRNPPTGAQLRIMSHELRTPLNGIIGYAQLLLRDKTLSATQVTGVSAILESGDHLLGLINALVDLAGVATGEVELTTTEIELRGLIAGVVDAVRARTGIELHSELAPGMPDAVHVDAPRLYQVLFTLLENAVKAGDPGGVVLRVAPQRGGCLSFSIRGAGRDVVESRPDSIAVALCRELVHLMGGELRVSSEPGAGSNFQFDIDASSPSGDDAR